MDFHDILVNFVIIGLFNVSKYKNQTSLTRFNPLELLNLTIFAKNDSQIYFPFCFDLDFQVYYTHQLFQIFLSNFSKL